MDGATTGIAIAVVGAVASILAAWLTSRPVRLRSKADREVEFRDDLIVLYRQAQDCCEKYRNALAAEEQRRFRAELRLERAMLGLPPLPENDEAEGS